MTAFLRAGIDGIKDKPFLVRMTSKKRQGQSKTGSRRFSLSQCHTAR